ncbi:MAG: GNAT family N-acetyltransferase [Acidimicrobiales bacterium]
MTRPELDVLVEWAAAEGWNPGLGDADVFWDTDPAGFIAAELDGEMIGGGSIVSYGGRFGFMGFFIIHPDHRGAGLGRELWSARRQLLLDRLDPGAPIGMDGVFAMQSFYEEGGFRLLHRDIRYEGPAPTGGGRRAAIGLVDAAEVDFADLDAYDRRHFPAPRPRFLERWISQPGGNAVAALTGGRIAGYGVARPCRVGHKIGPLFADDAEIAADLFYSLCGRLDGGRVQIDVPECNPAGSALVQRHGFTEVFGCARMVLGPTPELPRGEIFAVTTFELG